METIKQQLVEKTKILKNNSIILPKLEARLLLSKAVKKNLNWTFLNLEKKISKKKINLFNKLIEKKIRCVPTSYILKLKEFWGLNFKVNSHILIPRPETEVIISVIKKKFNSNTSFSILDLGTGSGCILLSILNEFPKAFGIGIDITSQIIKIARYNAKKNFLSKRSFFVQKDWNLKNSFHQLSVLNQKLYKKKKFDLIVSNPPYIPKKEIKNLMQEVKYEPRVALDGGYDGLQAYKNIFFKIKSVLSKDGSIYFEINPSSFENIKQILQKAGFRKITFINDLSNKKRVVVAK